MKFREVERAIEAVQHLRAARESLSSIGGDWVEPEMKNIDAAIQTITAEVKKAIGDNQ